MSIEDLKTKQDLERFITETVEQLPLNAIQGLPSELAMTLKADIAQVEVTIPEGQMVSAEVVVNHNLGSVPRTVGFVVFDETGTNTFGFRLTGRTDKTFTFVMNCATAAPVGGISRTVEWTALRGGEL